MESLVIGASRGVGLELARQLAAQGHRVFATHRDPATASGLFALARGASDVIPLEVDVRSESSLQSLARELGGYTDRLHRVIHVAGLLHGAGLGPERKLEEVDESALAAVFAVNAFGPILAAKHLLPFLRHGDPSVFASLSARVGSIEDNRLGGWYAYRASKAAQNQLLKTLSIELTRRARHCAVVALHPGTVDTDLSRPFQRSVPEGKLFTTERAARQLLEIIDGLKPEDTGSFIAWDGSPIPW